MKKLLLLLGILCICTGCTSRSEHLIERVSKNTEVLEKLEQKYRKDPTLNAEVEMNKIQLEKLLLELDDDLEKLQKLYKGETAHHLNNMVYFIPMMVDSFYDQDMMLFEQGYSYYQNGYANFIDFVEDKYLNLT